jgi:hypothetical protein
VRCPHPPSYNELPPACPLSPGTSCCEKESEISRLPAKYNNQIIFNGLDNRGNSPEAQNRHERTHSRWVLLNNKEILCWNVAGLRHYHMQRDILNSAASRQCPRCRSGSGKIVMISSLIRNHYKKWFENVNIFSSTTHLDPTFKTITEYAQDEQGQGKTYDPPSTKIHLYDIRWTNHQRDYGTVKTQHRNY